MEIVHVDSRGGIDYFEVHGEAKTPADIEEVANFLLEDDISEDIYLSFSGNLFRFHTASERRTFVFGLVKAAEIL